LRDSCRTEIRPCDAIEIVFVVVLNVFIEKGLVVEIEELEQNHRVLGNQLICWEVYVEFYDLVVEYFGSIC
jgi:phosphate starvation-inducible membrane PsiE